MIKGGGAYWLLMRLRDAEGVSFLNRNSREKSPFSLESESATAGLLKDGGNL